MHLSFSTVGCDTKVCTPKCFFLTCTPIHIYQETSTFVICQSHYYMLSRTFCHIYDSSLAFRLINIIISLFLHLVSFLFFREIIRIQSMFKIQFYIPLESHYIDNLELLRLRQISFYYVAHHGCDST